MLIDNASLEFCIKLDSLKQYRVRIFFRSRRVLFEKKPLVEMFA